MPGRCCRHPVHRRLSRHEPSRTHGAPVERDGTARVLLHRLMVRVRLAHMLVVGTLLLAATWMAERTVDAAGEIPPAACPGYVSHLQRARSFLADGNRPAAISELEQAKAALESCVRDNTERGAAGVVG